MTDYSYINLKPVQMLEAGDVLLASRPHERWDGLCPYGVVYSVSSFKNSWGEFSGGISVAQINLLKQHPDRLWAWGLITDFENPKYESFLDSRHTLNGVEKPGSTAWSSYINFNIAAQILDRKMFFVPILKT